MATLTELKRDRTGFPEAPELSPRVRESIEEIVDRRGRMERYVLGLLRLGVGWIFLWGFVDKLFGLGFATKSGDAWVSGGSPTFGFLNFATTGPFSGLYSDLAGNVVVDWLFMLGLLAIGLPLVLGVGVRIAASIGVVMLTLMYTAGFMPPEHNPFVDDHIMYGIVMVGLVVTAPGAYLGLGGLWAKTRLVRRYPVLR